MAQNTVRQAYSEVEPLLRTDKAAAALDMSPRSLEGMRLTGRGPRFVRISPRCVRYRPRDIESWVESRLRVSTSATKPPPLDDELETVARREVVRA